MVLYPIHSKFKVEPTKFSLLTSIMFVTKNMLDSLIYVSTFRSNNCKFHQFQYEEALIGVKLNFTFILCLERLDGVLIECGLLDRLTMKLIWFGFIINSPRICIKFDHFLQHTQICATLIFVIGIHILSVVLLNV